MSECQIGRWALGFGWTKSYKPFLYFLNIDFKYIYTY